MKRKIPTTAEQNAMLHALIEDLKKQVESLTMQAGELLWQRDQAIAERDANKEQANRWAKAAVRKLKRGSK